MRNIIEYFWSIIKMPLALSIPMWSVIFLPFQAMNNFLIGLILSFIMIYFFIRADFRDDEDRRDIKTLWSICIMFLAGGLPFLCLVFLPFQAPYNLLIGLFLSFVIFYFYIRGFKRGAN